MKHPDVIYCSPPWSSPPAREADATELEPNCTRCGARLSKYRAYTDTTCAPCQHATKPPDPTPNPCGCGCGGDCWPDYKGRGGNYAPGHHLRNHAA